jgi:hypothetical protein
LSSFLPFDHETLRGVRRIVNLENQQPAESWVGKEGRAGSPLPAAARTECAPYRPRPALNFSGAFAVDIARPAWLSSRCSTHNQPKSVNQPVIFFLMAILGSIGGWLSQRLRASGGLALILAAVPGAVIWLALGRSWG